jgi:hypothetical protein
MFSQLMKDAAPKAEAISNVSKNVASKAKNITTNLLKNQAVTIAKVVGYKALVNTVGVGMVLAQPLVTKAAPFYTKAVGYMKSLAVETSK